jgi:hypothetical protein
VRGERLISAQTSASAISIVTAFDTALRYVALLRLPELSLE